MAGAKRRPVFVLRGVGLVMGIAAARAWCEMQDHTKLLVWQRARSLVVTVHEAALAFPPSTVPGLRAQVMRATMSISANIAEGAAKSSSRLTTPDPPGHS